MAPMFSDYQYAYLIGDLVLGLPVWALLFYSRKDLRRQMLLSGILLGLLSVVTEHWYWDYWYPEGLNLWRMALGDFCYGFFPGAIACVVYKGIRGENSSKIPNERRSGWLVPLITLGACIFYIPLWFGVNSMYSTSLGFIAMASVMVYVRRDLLWPSLVSGAMLGLMTFLNYLILSAIFPGIIHAWWLFPANTSGITILGVPAEELLFGIALGAAAGPAYEFFRGFGYKSVPQTPD